MPSFDKIRMILFIRHECKQDLRFEIDLITAVLMRKKNPKTFVIYTRNSEWNSKTQRRRPRPCRRRVPLPPTTKERQKFFDAERVAAAAACYCIFDRVFETFGRVFNIRFREPGPGAAGGTYPEPTFARAIKNVFPDFKARPEIANG